MADTDQSKTSDKTVQPTAVDSSVPALDKYHGTPDHVELKDEIEPAATGPEAYYPNFAPIAALNLPDWQQTERGLVRRLDCTLLLMLWLLYWNNYLDRTNIAQAR